MKASQNIENTNIVKYYNNLICFSILIYLKNVMCCGEKAQLSTVIIFVTLYMSLPSLDQLN